MMVVMVLEVLDQLVLVKLCMVMLLKQHQQ